MPQRLCPPDQLFEPQAAGAEAQPLNLTPMVDVIFILLVFFLCVSQLKSGTLDIRMARVDPNATRGPGPQPEEPLLVEINRGGEVVVGGRRYRDLAPLARALKAFPRSRGGKQRVLLRGDTAVPHGLVMKVLATLHGAGLGAVEFEVEPSREER